MNSGGPVTSHTRHARMYHPYATQTGRHRAPKQAGDDSIGNVGIQQSQAGDDSTGSFGIQRSIVGDTKSLIRWRNAQRGFSTGRFSHRLRGTVNDGRDQERGAPAERREGDRV